MLAHRLAGGKPSKRIVSFLLILLLLLSWFWGLQLKLLAPGCSRLLCLNVELGAQLELSLFGAVSAHYKLHLVIFLINDLGHVSRTDTAEQEYRAQWLSLILAGVVFAKDICYRVQRSLVKLR